MQAKTGADDRLGKIESEVGMVKHRLKHIESAGGHADTKTLSKRCLRIEGRMEKVERLVERHAIVTEAALAVVRLLVAGSSDHLKDRHGVNVIVGDELDAHSLRSARRRLETMSQELAAIDKRTSA